ncbi:hypothetical protein [Altererythrobacter sp. Root672]|uniref:hypothetical protein n=1 Tax=Altererythrobacter sp. Root672 TaxID=1736584 RepID=UPI000B08A68B|nr:hypothetical protein [Altererythrobacter sp. Root672]
MDLGSRDVEELLAARHGIYAERRVAFRGRLEHLRKLGCPVGVQTGKGKPAVFGWSHLIELAVALDLVNLGLTPDHAATVITNHHVFIRTVFSALGTDGLKSSELLEAAQCEKWPFEKTFFLFVDVGSLTGLRKDGSKQAPVIAAYDAAELVQTLRIAPAGSHAHVLLDLGTIVANLIYLVSDGSKDDIASVAAQYARWSDENVVNP